MDKALMLLGLLLIATPLVVLTLGIGWLMDDDFDVESDTKGQHNTVSDIHSNVHSRHGRRGGDSIHTQRVGKGDRE